MELPPPKLPTGCSLLDQLLEGGYEPGIITTIYGPAASGKTNLCILPLIRTAGFGKKIIYIDTEASFSYERLKQLTKHHQKVLPQIIFFKPTNFEMQKKVFQNLKKIISDKIGLIIVDTISMLYRLEFTSRNNIQETNLEFSRQIAYLNAIARQYQIPVLITSQVYADFQERDKVNIVGGDTLKNWSKCLIELQKNNSKRTAIIRNHRSIVENKKADFIITAKGLEKV